MGWVTDALKELKQGHEVDVRPIGGSMRGRIESGQLVTIAPVNPAEIQVEDIALIEWKGGHLLHIVKELQGTEVLIGNNLGKINGWAPRSGICGKVIRVHPEPPTFDN